MQFHRQMKTPVNLRTQAYRLSSTFWRALPKGPRRRALSLGTAMLAPRPDKVPPASSGGLAIAGELSRPSGLGESARLLRAGLIELGIDERALDIGDPAQPQRQAGRIAIPPRGMPLLLHVNAPLLPLALLRAPRKLVRGRRVIGYWAWELPTMPAPWRVGLDFVHEVWVLSRFTGDAVATMLPSGSAIRIRVVPPPVALRPPQPSLLGRADFGLPDAAVVTLVSFSLASSLARKNPLAAIAAHQAAFGDHPDRILLIKAGHADRHPADMALLRAAAGGFGNIRFETRMFSDADRHALTACADIVLSLHRSEGLGLVPAEAMLLGRAVVATGWSATTEFMDAHSARLVDYRLIPARDPRGVFEAPGAVWAEAEIESAVAALRELADDADLRARLGAAAIQTATRHLGVGPLADAMAGLSRS
jgi:glycosyltransferase involved in cell wall biosynthesis